MAYITKEQITDNSEISQLVESKMTLDFDDFAIPVGRLLKFIDDLPPADVAPSPYWISVEERLPRDSKHVLVWVPARRVVMLGWYYQQLNGWYDERHTVCGVIHPTHWMPLPEPPKEVE